MLGGGGVGGGVSVAPYDQSLNVSVVVLKTFDLIIPISTSK